MALLGYSFGYFSSVRTEWEQDTSQYMWGRLQACDEGVTRLLDCIYEGDGKEFGFTHATCTAHYQMSVICHNGEGTP